MTIKIEKKIRGYAVVSPTEAQEAQAQNIQAQQQSAMMNNQGKAQVEQVKGQNQLQNSQAQADLDLRNEMIAKGMEAGVQA